MSGPEINTLYYGDCLDWMKRWDDGCVDLVYLDPPFNSKVNYNVLYSTEGNGEAQYRAFDDTWRWDEAAVDRFAGFEGAAARAAHQVMVGLHRILGRSGMLAYLTYMAERLEQIHRVLKPRGSVYLHCDPTASHYLKLVMDAIFGAGNFRNEIIWCYKRMASKGQRHFSRCHDILLCYGKTRQTTFNVDAVRLPYAESSLQREGYRKTSLGGAAPASGVCSLHEGGRFPEDWWDIPILRPNAKERLGYPTQKPLGLLERIIEASSKPGDLVLDPFCGCGTTIAAAEGLGRRWAGIDISSFAIDLIISRRMKGRFPAIPTRGIPRDLASARKLAAEHPFDFESWAVTRLPGFAPNTKQIADGGVDGRAFLAAKPDNFDSRLALAQVKGGKYSLSYLRDFLGVMHRDRAALGCFITLEPVTTAAARSEAAALGKIRVGVNEYRRMQLWPIADYFQAGRRGPSLPAMNDPYTGKAMNQGDLELF